MRYRLQVTLDKPFTGAWEGGRAPPWQSPWCKEGVRLPKGIPRGLRVTRDCHRAGVMGDAVGDAQKSFKAQQGPRSFPRVPLGSFQSSSAPGMGSLQSTFTALIARWVLKTSLSP